MNKLFFTSIATLGLISSFVFGVIAACLVYLESFDVSIAIGFTIIVNLTMWLAGPFISDLINKWFYKIKFYTPEEFKQLKPDLYSLVNKICNEHKFSFPKIGIVPDRNPTAYTYGSARYNARVVMTEGIFEFLNTEEQKAILAHEMGHIVNRDFMVLMIASTLLQILYEIYATLAKRSGNSKKKGARVAIGMIALVLYYISIYLLYFLSRTREYLADAFSAKETSASDLARALIKVAYGITVATDTDSGARLLQSTRHLGIVDVKHSKELNITSMVNTHEPSTLAKIMAFDLFNWWAKIAELSSTHPLTGKRLLALQRVANENHQEFIMDIEQSILDVKFDNGKMLVNFVKETFMSYFAIIGVLAFVLFAPYEQKTSAILLSPTVFGLVGILVAIYRYSQHTEGKSSVLELMSDPYASPVKGRRVALEGKIIGRGDAGNIFGDDMMFSDQTGLLFLDFRSKVGGIGEFLFGWKKAGKLVGQKVTTECWFFRSMGPYMVLANAKTENETINSHPIIGSVFAAVICIAVNILFIVLIR